MIRTVRVEPRRGNRRPDPVHFAIVATPLPEGNATAVRAGGDVLGTLLQDHGTFGLTFPRFQRPLLL